MLKTVNDQNSQTDATRHSSSKGFTAVILAAGLSSRFGSDKLLHRFRTNNILWHSIASAIRGGAGKILVVTTSERAESFKENIVSNPFQSNACINYIINQNVNLGMLHSFYLALQHIQKFYVATYTEVERVDSSENDYLSKNDDLNADLCKISPLSKNTFFNYAAISLGDKPLIKPETYRNLHEMAEKRNKSNGSTIIPVYKDVPGHPVFFPFTKMNRLIEVYKNLQSDNKVQEHSVRYALGDDVINISIDDPGITRDIDRPEDLDLIEGVYNEQPF